MRDFKFYITLPVIFCKMINTVLKKPLNDLNVHHHFESVYQVFSSKVQQ